MKSEKDYLMKIRYLYFLRHKKLALGFTNEDMDFKESYNKNKEEWKKKFMQTK